MKKAKESKKRRHLIVIYGRRVFPIVLAVVEDGIGASHVRDA
jgi:hypothetical protein